MFIDGRYKKVYRAFMDYGRFLNGFKRFSAGVPEDLKGCILLFSRACREGDTL